MNSSCLALHPTLKQLESRLRQLDPKARVLAYLDDVHILISPTHMPQALQIATSLLQPAGLHLNHTKNETWNPEHTSLLSTFPCPRIERPTVMRLQAHATPVLGDEDAEDNS